jgi:hypothetical protein
MTTEQGMPPVRLASAAELTAAAGRPLAEWTAALDAALSGVAPGTPGGDAPGGEASGGDAPGTGWAADPAGAALLDAALARVYAFGAAEGEAVPLPVVAASLVALPRPGGSEVAPGSAAVLEEVAELMARLDEGFRGLAGSGLGLLEYRPVEDDPVAALAADPGGPAGQGGDADSGAEVARYGVVRLTPLGVYGVRERLLAAGTRAPLAGELADRPAEALLEALAGYPGRSARTEAESWLRHRKPEEAARELLAAAGGDDPGAPRRRLAAQQTLSLLDDAAEPALREVLDDRRLGGLARVWLSERGAADVPPPDEAMVFWLTMDTLAAQLDADEDPALLQELVSGLAAQHDGFFAAAWRVDHPATAEVLEAVGRLHPDRRLAKEARKAAFRARSRAGEARGTTATG